MKKIIITIVLLATSTLIYSQCACCAGAGIGATNGDYNNGILTLSKKMIVVETYTDFRSIQKGDAPEMDEKLLTSMRINSVGIRYGVSKKLTVSALLPYVNLYTNNGSDSGFGDLIVLGTYSIYQKNNFSFAIQGGIKLPTGIQKDSNFDDSKIIIGSGSYDPMGGILVSKNWKNFTLNGNVLYKKSNPGFENNYYGSLSTQSLTLSYKIKGETTICSLDENDKKTKPNFGLTANLGYTGEWLDKLKENDIVDDNSGHYLGLANVGATISYKKWAMPINFSEPIINKMNGMQNNFGYRFRIGIIKAF
ncbi:transporter [Flavobacterium sp.]|uniref:transporter n=1 Tax=Flavobacterium sp. TaxID=239 RepID=UPI0038D067D5